MMRSRNRTVLMLVWMSTSYCWSQAQSSAVLEMHEAGDKSDGVSIREQVRALQQQQKSIIEQINLLAKRIDAISDLAPPKIDKVIRLRNEPFKGDSEANIAIVEYGDFECPFCAQFEREVYPHILTDYVTTGKVRYYFRNFPLSNHPNAAVAANAAMCAKERGKLWEIRDDLFSHQSQINEGGLLRSGARIGINDDRFEKCVKAHSYLEQVQNDVVEAESIGVAATPTVFIGTIDANANLRIEETIKGAYPYERFKLEIDRVLGAAPHKSQVAGGTP